TRQYTFTLPAGLPGSDHAVFSWSWVNAIGNREFYNLCSDVSITGGSAPYTGKQMTIANHAGYPTIPEFDGNYDTGLQYYTNATSITVTGSGSSSPAPGSSNYAGASADTPIAHAGMSTDTVPPLAASTAAAPNYSAVPAPTVLSSSAVYTASPLAPTNVYSTSAPVVSSAPVAVYSTAIMSTPVALPVIPTAVPTPDC
ncbi:hypothetical protein EV174_007058, partial [Coemansia sp. RSA 2320]